VRRINIDMVKNVCLRSRKIPVALVRRQRNLNFLEIFSKNTQISNYTKIRQIGAEFFHADRRTMDRQREGETDRQTRPNYWSRFAILWPCLIIIKHTHFNLVPARRCQCTAGGQHIILLCKKARSVIPPLPHQFVLSCRWTTAAALSMFNEADGAECLPSMFALDSSLNHH
jgi:hypothetical protein